FVKELFDILEEKIGDPELTVSRLAEEMHLTTESLRRKLKELTGLSTQKLLCQIRVGLAALYLEKTTNSITWIAFEVGFNSSSYFAKCFQEFYDRTPLQYRRQAAALSPPPEGWISEFGRRFSAPKT
ncbi:helix-turn-helix transcriptional regulator, partial [bacterium]|nr:helix-turn-helix transcriptional regulator [bacterium]